jgi:predicted lipid carrier protein YhbT
MLETAPRPILRVPGLVGMGLRPLPLLPLELLLQGLADGIVARHPVLLERLATGRVQRIGIDPNDLPFALVLEAHGGRISLRVVRELGHETAHARISGPLLGLIGLVDGASDGDALFFSRDVVVEGQVEAVVTLRNAIDDAEINLLHELVAWAGSLAGSLQALHRGLLEAVGRVLGRESGKSGGGLP